jgi:adenylosuccinate synthase
MINLSCLGLIGNGVVIDAKELMDDLNAIEENGIEY